MTTTTSMVDALSRGDIMAIRRILTDRYGEIAGEEMASGDCVLELVDAITCEEDDRFFDDLDEVRRFDADAQRDGSGATFGELTKRMLASDETRNVLRRDGLTSDPYDEHAIEVAVDLAVEADERALALEGYQQEGL